MLHQFRFLCICVFFLLIPLCLTAQAPPAITIYGINPSGGTQGSWIESFNITIDPTKVPPVTAEEISACPDSRKLRSGGGILVVRSDIYYSVHGNDPNLYINGQKNPVFNARTVSGYAGFSNGIGDVSGDDTHLWVNPWDRSGMVFEFVPDPKKAVGWTVAAPTPFSLANAADKYDGMEVFGKRIYANRKDAGFALTGADPCKKSPNAIYDEYDATNGKLLTAGLIKPTFPASGLAFDGTYFFISDICNNKIAVYDKTGKLIGEADLGALPANPPACVKPGDSFCLNPKLTRCLEDLSTVVSPPPGAEFEASKPDLLPPSPQGTVTDIEVVSMAASPVKSGAARALTVILHAKGGSVADASVTFTAMLGDVHFVSGQLSEDGKESAVFADQAGRATVDFVAGQPGLSLIQVSSGVVIRAITISASSIESSEPR